MIITHVGGPTALIEIDGWRLLTDPTFDPAGDRYRFGWGTSSTKLIGPGLAVADLPPVDAVLLTHDHHGDNLDRAGRALLASVPTVVTTVSGARRLRLPDARGLVAGDTTRLAVAGRPALDVTATPARHGPPLSRPIVGDVVGFAVRRSDAGPASVPGSGSGSGERCGDSGVALWITGDTVPHRRLRETAATMAVDVAIIHIGGVRFPVTGPLRYTMTGRDAVKLLGLVRPRLAVPVHYEGWSHFRDGRATVERALASAPQDVRQRVRWLPIGVPQQV